jgi:lipopolysaccharide heptosyltransferase II
LKAISKILVVRLSSIGDIILTTPLLRSLKNSFPDAKITYLIKKQYAELLINSPYINELVTFDSTKGMADLKAIRRRFKQEKFDLFIDIHKNWRSMYLRWGLGASKTTTYNKLIFKRTMLIWFKINLYNSIRPVFQRYFDSVREFGITYDGTGTEISIPEMVIEKVKFLLSEEGYSPDKRLVVVCPSATYFNKRWMPDGFIETSRYLMREKSAFIVIHGGKDDRPLCGMMASSIGKGSANMAGTLNLAESAALLKLASLVIANDSGLLHLAQSQKTPVVGIYGPTTRELGYFPVEQSSTVIETTISCRPCTHNGLNYCPKKHFRCMKDINTNTVINAALQYLP